MKKIILAIFLLIETIAFAQNVTIDYQAWNPTSQPCNIFGNSTNVPATGTTSGTIPHKTRIGQPSYAAIDKGILMPTEFVTTSSVSKGTSFIIDYNFKANYTYTITINAAANSNASLNPYIRIDRNNNAGGGGNTCNGADNINPNLSGNPAAAQVNSTTFINYPFGPFVQGSNQPSLEVSAIPASNGGFKTVVIRKITIVETPPPPTFTLSPNSSSITCGTSVTRNFVVTNVYNSPGTLAYSWNLGGNNGWLYQGNPAPSTISTTSNSISLTSSVTATTLSNVNVVVSLNGSSVSNLTSNVSFITPGGNYAILGNDIPCINGTTTYTLGHTPPTGTTANWSISPNDGTITLTPNGNSVILDATNATLGINYNLNVTIIGNCYLGTGSKQFVIPVEPFQGQVYGLQGWSNTLYGAALVVGDNYFYTGSGANYFEVWINNYGEAFPGGYWEHVSGDYATYTGGNQFLGFDLSYGGVDAYYNYHFTDNCGSNSIPFHFITSSGYPPSNRIQINNDPKLQLKLSPNPANSFIYISVQELINNKLKLGRKVNPKSFDYNTAKKISVYDKLGVLVLQQKSIISKTGLRLNVSGLRNNEMYSIIVEDEKSIRLSGKFMKF